MSLIRMITHPYLFRRLDYTISMNNSPQKMCFRSVVKAILRPTYSMSWTAFYIISKFFSFILS